MVPEISIITVVFNAAKTIQKSIESVINQDSANVELIIIDGGSTDGTVQIIEKYRSKIAYFVSENDRGIYDAMNKGIDAANGNYLFFLGADDFMYDITICSAIENAIQEASFDVILGNIIYTSGTKVKPSFTSKLLLHNSIHHQGTFYNRNLFEKFRYDSKYKLISDYELNLILYLKKESINVLRIDRLITLCSDNGASRTMMKTMRSETDQIRQKHLPLYKAKLLSLLFGIKLKIWNAIRHN